MLDEYPAMSGGDNAALRTARFLQSLCDEKLDPVFWRAALLSRHSAWCGHIPFAHWLVGAVAPRVFVELGTHTGVSYSAFCAAVERTGRGTRCYAVDTWQGDEHSGHYDNAVYEALANFHNPRFGSFSTLLRCTFDEALPFIEDGSVDLLHIDGLHTYDAVLHDFEAWRPKLSDRAVVLFHDTNERDGDFGVWRLWSELQGQFPSLEFLHGHGLGVLAVGSAVPPGLAPLLSQTDPVIRGRVRDRFALIGTRWDAEQSCLYQSEQAASKNATETMQVHKEFETALAIRDEKIAKSDDDIATLQSNTLVLSDRLAQTLSESEAERSARSNAEVALRDAVAEIKKLLATTRADAETIHNLQQGQRKAAEDDSVARLHLQSHLGAVEVQLSAANHSIAQLHGQIQHTELSYRDELSRRLAVETSSIWRATWLLRRFLMNKPSLRRNLRRSFHLAWWAVTLQIARRLKDRRKVMIEAERVRRSALFDGAWYLLRYPDAAASGLEPEVHFVVSPATEQRDPGPGFSTAAYLHRYPEVREISEKPYFHYLAHGIQEGRDGSPIVITPPAVNSRPATEPVVEPNIVNHQLAKSPIVSAAISLLDRRFSSLKPFSVFRVPGEQRRITMVTDSINAGSLFGGVATSIIWSALLAKRLGAQLRIVTRTDAANVQNVAAILSAANVVFNGTIVFSYISLDSKEAVSLGDDEIFITTSWWSTCWVLPIVPPHRIHYLLQEDERMFYAYSDDRLRCAEVLSNSDIKFIINTKLLFDHFVTGLESLPNIERNGIWFEPAFPVPSELIANNKGASRRRQFLFYARPNNLRNLYWRGLEAIATAIEENVLDPEMWDFHFVGKDLEPIELPRGVMPTIAQNLPWQQYNTLINTIDVGLCLMDTPHPSYPPLDLATAGGIAVTNRHGSKVSLDRYSNSIICAEPTVAGLVGGLSEAVSRAGDLERRCHDLQTDRINRDWNLALEEPLCLVCRKLQAA